MSFHKQYFSKFIRNNLILNGGKMQSLFKGLCLMFRQRSTNKIQTKSELLITRLLTYFNCWTSCPFTGAEGAAGIDVEPCQEVSLLGKQ
jgi:hypothetical protein